tara:strand:+ start:43459 stop:44286 length:828 start_codon:yes stop_codon:yes gene_type:complete
MLKALFSLATFSLLISTIHAQNRDSSLILSNRMGLIESSRTVIKGGFMLEGGLLYFYDKQKGAQGAEIHHNFMTLPRLRLSYGVTKFMEVSVEESFSHLNVTSNTGYSESLSFSRYRFGLKFNLTKQNGIIPQSALSVSERLRITNINTVEFSPILNFSWNYKWGTHVNLSGDITYTFNKQVGDDVNVGLRLGYDFKNKIGVYSEVYLVGHNLSTAMVSAGLNYQVSSRLVLSAGVGTDVLLYNERPSLSNILGVNVGVSFLLNNPNKETKKRKR